MFGRIVHYIQAHYMEEDLTVEKIAKEYYTSRMQLFRLFKKALGVSPQQYLVQVRMNHAATLLRTTTQTVNDIKRASGYGSSSWFYKMFQQTYGYSPDTYRTQCTKEWNKTEDTSVGLSKQTS